MKGPNTLFKTSNLTRDEAQGAIVFCRDTSHSSRQDETRPDLNCNTNIGLQKKEKSWSEESNPWLWQLQEIIFKVAPSTFQECLHVPEKSG